MVNSTTSAANSTATINHAMVLTYVDQDGLFHRIGLVDASAGEVNVGIPLTAAGELTSIDLWEKAREVVNISAEIRAQATLHTKAACVKKENGAKTYYHEVHLGQLTDAQVALLKKQTEPTPTEKKEERYAPSVYEASLQNKVLYDVTVGAQKKTEILYKGVRVAEDEKNIARQVDMAFNSMGSGEEKVNYFVAETIEQNIQQRFENKKLHKISHQVTTLNGRTIHAEVNAAGQLKRTYATKGREACTYLDKASIENLRDKVKVVGRGSNNTTLAYSNRFVADNLLARNDKMAQDIAIMYGEDAIRDRRSAYRKCLSAEKEHFNFVQLEEPPLIDLRDDSAEDIKSKSKAYTDQIMKVVRRDYFGNQDALEALFRRQLQFVERMEAAQSPAQKEKKESLAYYAVMKEVFGDPGSENEEDAILDKMRDEIIAAEWSKAPSPRSFVYIDAGFHLVETELKHNEIQFTNIKSMQEYWDRHFREEYRKRLVRMRSLAGEDLETLKRSVPDDANKMQERVEQLYLARKKEKNYQDAYERFQYLAADVKDLDAAFKKEPDISPNLEENTLAFRMACHLQLKAQKRTIESLEGSEEEKDNKYRERVVKNIMDDSDLKLLPDGENIPDELKDLYQKISDTAGINLKSFWNEFGKHSGQNIMLLANLIVAILVLLLIDLPMRVVRRQAGSLDPANVKQMIEFNLKELSEKEIESMVEAVNTLMNLSVDGSLNLKALDEKFFQFNWASVGYDPEFNRQRRERAMAMMAAIAMAPPLNFKGKITFPEDLHGAQKTAEWLTGKIKANSDEPYKKVHRILKKNQPIIVPGAQATSEEIGELIGNGGNIGRLIDSSVTRTPVPSAPPDPVEAYYHDHIESLDRGAKDYILDNSMGSAPADSAIMGWINNLQPGELKRLQDLIRDDLNRPSSRP